MIKLTKEILGIVIIKQIIVNNNLGFLSAVPKFKNKAKNTDETLGPGHYNITQKWVNIDQKKKRRCFNGLCKSLDIPKLTLRKPKEMPGPGYYNTTNTKKIALGKRVNPHKSLFNL